MEAQDYVNMNRDAGDEPESEAGKTNPHSTEVASPISEQPVVEKRPPTVAVFECPASYHPWTWILLGIAVSAPLLSMIIIANDRKFSSQKKREAHFALFWVAVAILLLYIAVLPRRFKVYSNARIAVITWLFTFNFDNVSGAYRDVVFDEDTVYETLSSDSLTTSKRRHRFKFSTNFNKRVIVQRKNGAWDVIVSPSNTKGFVTAVCNLAADLEEGNSSS